MPKILMLRGLPGSGKSTLARKLVEEKSFVRVNKDDLRAMAHNSKHTPKREEFILTLRDMIISSALGEGKNVVVDDTNLHPKHEKRLRELADALHCDFEEDNSLLLVPIEQCIEQDLKRLNSVGEQVIRKMHKEAVKHYPHLLPKPAKAQQPYVAKPGTPKTIICDLDGTLALMNGRDPFDASTCENDLLNKVVYDIISEYPHNVIFVSGRSDKYREQTKRWLGKYGLAGFPLFMRKENDFRKDSIVKLEIFDNHIRDHYDVSFVLDDRNQVVEMWRSLGLTCLQVADGNF